MKKMTFLIIAVLFSTTALAGTCSGKVTQLMVHIPVLATDGEGYFMFTTDLVPQKHLVVQPIITLGRFP